MTTESHNPLDAALDLFVFVPVGLAITAAEELPKMAAKGRSRVATQLTMARVVGQFAVARGRSMIESRIEAATPPARPTPPAGPAPTARPEPAEGPDLSYDELLGRESSNGSARPTLRPVPDAPTVSGPATGSAERIKAASLPGADRTESNAAVRASVAGDLAPVEREAAAADPSSLAIPGYDSLSASQVVQRLAGLSRDELAAVGAYEEAHRGRRTILNRVNQLQGQ